MIELDSGTAGIPWELLDNQAHGERQRRRGPSARSCCASCERVRFRPRSGTPLPTTTCLVIGEPECDRTKYPQLYGRAAKRPRSSRLPARFSVSDVEGLIRWSATTMTDPFPNARAVVNAHVEEARGASCTSPATASPPSEADARGVVLSDETFLGSDRDRRACGTIPELVFVNCCYPGSRLGRAVPEADELRPGQVCVRRRGGADQGRRALCGGGGVGGRRRRRGGICDNVLRQAWSRRDVHRSRCGCPEGGLAQAATPGRRISATAIPTGDIGARRRTRSGPAPPPDPAREFASIASASALVLALETLAVKSEFQHADSAAQADRLRYLQETYGRFWSDNGQVAEAFGNAWAKAGDFEEAVGWYEQARTAADGTSPLTAIEQLANLKVRIASARVADANAAEAAVQAAARKDITEAMSLLDILLAVGPTLERESLYGSAYKRLAYIEGIAGNDAAETVAITSMMEHYTAAERIARKKQEENPAKIENVFYPAMNRIAAQLALQGGTEQVAKLDGDTLKAVRDSMLAMPPDFWSVLGQTELKMYEALSAGTLEQQLHAVSADFQAQHARVSAPKRG